MRGGGWEVVLRQNVASHNVYVTKRSITQRSNNTYYCNVLAFFNVYVLELLRF
jgi:hypothetical protein